MEDKSIQLAIQKMLENADRKDQESKLQRLSVPEQMESERRQDWNEGNPLERFVSPVPEYMKQQYPSNGLFPNLKRYFNEAPVYKKGNKLEE